MRKPRLQEVSCLASPEWKPMSHPFRLSSLRRRRLRCPGYHNASAAGCSRTGAIRKFAALSGDWKLVPNSLEARAPGFLVGTHKLTVTCHISGEYGSQLAYHALGRHSGASLQLSAEPSPSRGIGTWRPRRPLACAMQSATGHHATKSANRIKSASPSASEISATLRHFGFVPKRKSAPRADLRIQSREQRSRLFDLGELWRRREPRERGALETGYLYPVRSYRSITIVEAPAGAVGLRHLCYCRRNSRHWATEAELWSFVSSTNQQSELRVLSGP